MPFTGAIPDGWELIGRTINTRYFLATGQADVVLVVPNPRSDDDAASARENLDFQMGYARALGRPCAFVVLLGALRAQAPAARKVYADGMDPVLCCASALVVNDVLSRAIGSFFLGLSRPRTPTRTFDTLDAAIAWAAASRPRAS